LATPASPDGTQAQPGLRFPIIVEALGFDKPPRQPADRPRPGLVPARSWAAALDCSGDQPLAKKKDYYKWESSYGSFCRSFALPAEIQPDKVKSTYKDGVLEGRMPKTEAAKSNEVKVKIQ